MWPCVPHIVIWHAKFTGIHPGSVRSCPYSLSGRALFQSSLASARCTVSGNLGLGSHIIPAITSNQKEKNQSKDVCVQNFSRPSVSHTRAHPHTQARPHSRMPCTQAPHRLHPHANRCDHPPASASGVLKTITFPSSSPCTSYLLCAAALVLLQWAAVGFHSPSSGNHDATRTSALSVLSNRNYNDIGTWATCQARFPCK